MNVLIVSALGFVAFSLLFESGGRYTLSMAPVFVLLAVCAASGRDARPSDYSGSAA